MAVTDFYVFAAHPSYYSHFRNSIFGHVSELLNLLTSKVLAGLEAVPFLQLVICHTVL